MTAEIRKLLYCARIRARARMVNYRYFTIKNSAIGRVGDFPQNKGLFLQNKGLFLQNKGFFLRKVLDYLTKQKSLSPTTLKGLIHDVAIPPINPRPLICPSVFFRKFAGREQDAHTTFSRLAQMELDILPLGLPTDTQRPLVIAGPCSAETEEQVVQTAQALAEKGCHIFRAGVWKPRTKPGGFEGVGERALKWLQRVKRETGMLVGTEVATPEHVELCLQHDIDLLWIGARTTANPFAVQSLADCLQGVDVPVLVKNPVSPDLELWIGAMQRLNQAGIQRIGAIHRGFSSYNNKLYRNNPTWQIPIELRRRIPELPIIGDPSHIGGKRELIAPLCQQAMDLGFDGLIIETHCTPDKAWSDAAQQVTPDVLHYILSLLVVRDKRQQMDEISDLRQQIDDIDHQFMELLAQRMRVCRQIGQYKRDHNVTVFQANRYNEILDKRSAQGALCGMNAEFIATIFESIHEESVRQQMDVIHQ